MMLIYHILFTAIGIAAIGEEPLSIEEFLQKLSTVPDVVTRKDPFVEAKPPYQTMVTDANAVAAKAPILQRYPLVDYVVVAVLLGDQYPRALIRLPTAEANKVLIVKEKDKLGNRGGVITKIAKDGVVVMENVRSPLGFVDKAEIKIEIGSKIDKEKKPAISFKVEDQK